MSAQARLPTIPPPAPDVEALLGYERDFVGQLDIVRARALARARHALQENSVPSSGQAILGHQHVPMPVAVGAMVAIWLAAALELLLSTGLRQAAGSIKRLSDPLVDGASADSEPYASRPLAETFKATVARPVVAASEDGLEELRLLDRARQFDRRGDYSAALAATREHQRRFSDGRLVEEREALRIWALMGLGRVTEAGEAAALFRRRFPRSVLLETIDRMMASLR